MSTVLVAGATGYLGRHITEELCHCGHRVRAAVHDRARAEKERPWKSSSLGGLVEEWTVGDVVDPGFTKDLVGGATRVTSALDVTRQKADPWQIDNLANRAILASALRHGIASFAYVNVLGEEKCPAKPTRVETIFARALEQASVLSQIVNPSACFSDMISVLGMAKRSKVRILDPTVRLNPIHGVNLAVCICNLMEKGEKGSWGVGGPDVSTWDELARTAFTTMGKRPCVGKIPTWTLPPALGLTSLFGRRPVDAARFTTRNTLHDYVGSATGARHLADFYVENRNLVRVQPFGATASDASHTRPQRARVIRKTYACEQSTNREETTVTRPDFVALQIRGLGQAASRPGLGAVLWLRCNDAHKLHSSLAATGTPLLGEPAPDH